MAGAAPRDRPVTTEARRRVAVATETEVVKTRFGAHPKVCSAAAMTTDARIGAGAIDKVVMTLNAVHLPMPVVRKAQDEWFTTPHEWLTQGECRAATQ